MAEVSNENISPTGCIDYANRLMELCDLPFPRISSIQNIDSEFFVSLFECITGHEVPDLLVGSDSVTEAHNIQALINTLSLDLLSMDLSYLTGENIVSLDIISILNLLELLEAVFLHLFSKKGKDLKDASVSSAQELVENDAVAISSTEKHVIKAASVKSLVSSSDEHVPVKRILKRKTCKNTLRKYPNSHIPKKKMPETSQIDSAEPSHSKRHSDTVGSCESSLKRRISKPSSRTVKRPHTENIEQLYELNFEMKVKTLLHCDKAPMLRAQQMKKNYIQSLKTPLKKTHIPPCKKSFLLPHNLRPKSKPHVRQSPTKKRTSEKKNGVKYSTSENPAKCEKDDDAPATFQFVMDEFPGFKFPKNTLDILTKHYYQHVGQMHKQLRNTLLKKPTTLTQTEKALENEAKLRKILVKDLKEKKYLREFNEERFVGTKIKCGFRDARLRSAKTRQYFEEFHLSMSRKLQKRNYSEEVLVERTLKEILNQQKEKVRLLCQRVKEMNEQDAKQHREYLSALKNLYQQQLSVLAEQVNAEQKESSEIAKAQELTIGKMNQEFRMELQKEVRSLHKNVLGLIEDIHFRELDAQNFIRSFQEED